MTSPTQPQPVPQPAPPAPAAPKKSKAPLIIGIVAAVVLVLCGGTVACVAMFSSAVDDAVNNPAQPGGGDDPSNADDGDTNSGNGSGDDEPAGNVAGGIGDPVRDGKFEFTVTDVECGIERVGDEFFNEDAQGQFCKVYLTVKNIGDEPQMFSDSDQFAFNADGQKYEADSGAALYLDEESNAFLENINPGNSVEGIILFDIPKDAKIVRLELHDSFFSGGVTVEL